jgi:DNA polymerase I
MNGTLFIVDALNYLFRAFHALPPLTTKAGQPTGAVYGLCQMLLRIEREHQPSHMCVVFDAPGRTFRDDLFGEYKANRSPTPPELLAQIDLAHEVAKAFGYTVLSVEGVEADDVIATLVRMAKAEKLAVVIGSSDKDLMQLCSEDVKLLDAMKNRLLGPAEVVEKWFVPPEKLGDVLALMGDSVDNVPGVPGIGPKTAAELINTYGSLEGVLANVDKIKGKKAQAIAQARETLAVSRQLVRLREDVALSKPLAELRRVPAAAETLRELFTRLEFGRLLAQLGPAAIPAAAETITEVAAEVLEAGPAPAAVAVVEEPEPRTVGDKAGLSEMASTIERAGEVAISALFDHDSPLRAGLSAMALATPDGTRYYVPIRQGLFEHRDGLSEEDLLAALGPVLSSSSVAKHLHNGKLLDVFLRAHGRSLAGVKSDTMLGAYLLDAGRAGYDLAMLAVEELGRPLESRAGWVKVGRGLRHLVDAPLDAKAPRHLGAEAAAILALASKQDERLTALKQQSLYREVELALSPVLAAMEAWGIRLDSDYLRSLGAEVDAGAKSLETEIHALAGGDFNIASPKQLAEILFGKLQLPIVKKTKTGASTDADVLEELAALHPMPAKILEYRTLTKLKGTYIDALPALVNPRTRRLHTTFQQAVAATGRLSSSDPNLQNIPIRSEIGRKIRHAFVADPGYQIVSADYSQIELRVLAHFSEDPAFLDAFRSGADIHRRTAAEVFGVAQSDVTDEQRRIAKAINFGLVFGQTDFGLAQVLRIPRGEAHKYIQSYFERYARVRSHMDAMIADARRTQVVSTLLGRTRALPEIASKRPQDRNYAERIARNTPIQGSAADILKLAMLRVARGLSKFPQVRLLLTVHDELVFEVPTGEVEAFCPWVKAEMEAAYELRVPLVVEVHGGPSWGDAH